MIIILPLIFIMLLLLSLFLIVLGFTKRWFVAGSTTLGAVAGAVVGFWIGEANAPPQPGSIVIGPSDWAIYGGFLGLLIGSVLGAKTSAAIVRRRRVKRRGVAQLQGRPE